MDCEAFLARMTPLAGWAARRKAAPHPLLAQPDLFQDAMETLLRVWRQHYPKSPEDLCRIGRVAVLRKLAAVRAHAYSRGEGEVTAWVDLDQPLYDSENLGSGLRISDLLGADGIEDVFFWFGLDELERTLDDLGRAVLGELLDPGERTLRAIRQVWRRRAGVRGKGGNWWAKYRTVVVARGLRVPPAVVGSALRRVRQGVREVFLTREPLSEGYREVGGRGGFVNRHQERSGVMGGQAGFVPDEPGAGLPEPGPTRQKPAAGAPGAKAKKAAAKKQAATKAAAGTRKTGNGNSKVFPRPGTLKARAAELYLAGKSASDAAKQLKGKVGTFRSWWGAFRERLAKPKNAS